MGKLVSPKVFLVGRTEMNDAGMNDYLRHTGNEEFIEEIEKARSQGIPDGLILCSFFAKLCYAALVVGKNDNITRVREIRDNLVATFDAGHGSVFEHCSINFVITGCSRVFTHELVRHRVGTAFSQTSGRYVRTDSLDIVFDPILEPVKEDIKEIQFYLEQKYAAMVKKMGLDEMKDFDKKKKATSALRRILPNGQANEIGFTLNVRSLRHLTELRTARFSEWEIREVFNQIASLIQTHFPWAFHGATMEICDGLLEYSGMVQQPYGKRP